MGLHLLMKISQGDMHVLDYYLCVIEVEIQITHNSLLP